MQQQTTQLRRFFERVPFVVDINIRPSDVTRSPTSCCRPRPWGEYTYTRENLERRLRVNQQFYDPPGEVRAEYLIFVQIAQRLAQQPRPARRQRVAVHPLGGRLRRACTRPRKASRSGSTTSRPQRADRRSAPTGSSSRPARGQQARRHRAHLHRQVRHRRRPRSLHRRATTPWTTPTRSRCCPRRSSPTPQYPFFVTTVRYQTIWQSGYTYRWLTDLARAACRSWSSSSTPPTPSKAGLNDGDWAELRNQYAACEGVVNVSDQVPPGRDVGDLRLAGPERRQPVRRSRSTTRTTWSPAGRLQQKSNGAFFKNTRGAAAQAQPGARTAKNSPGLLRTTATSTRQRARRGRRPQLEGEELRLGRAAVSVHHDRPAAGPSAGGGSLRDAWGREIHSLRISVTDRCNFRCRYCMPAEGLPWLPKPRGAHLRGDPAPRRGHGRMGVDEIRLTGGEPLVRRDLPQLVGSSPRHRACATSHSPPTACCSTGSPPRWSWPGCDASTSRSTRSRTPASPRSPAATRSTAS